MDNMMNYTFTEFNNEIFDNNVMMMYIDRDDVVTDYPENNNYHDNSLDIKYRSIDLASAMANHSSSYEHNMMYSCNSNKLNNNIKYSSIYNFCLYPNYSCDIDYTYSNSQSREMKEGLCPLFDENISNSKKQHIINITNVSTSSDDHYHHDHSIDEQQFIIQIVSTCLMTIFEFDFSAYLRNESMWKGKHLKGSVSCEVEISLFYDNKKKIFVLDAKRIKKDDCSFSGCYQSLLAKLRRDLEVIPIYDSQTTHAPSMKKFITPNLKAFIRQPTDQEFLDGIQPIFMMIKHKDSTVESRIQAAKMLCDVSGKNICYLELEAFRTECVNALKALLNDEDADVRQYAVMATAAFAELPCYVDLILHSSILVAMFELVESTPSHSEAYATAQVRRTAASLLAILSKSHPYIVKAELEKQHCDVEGWLKNTSVLSREEDLRTRESSMSIRTFLADIPSIKNSSIIIEDDYSIDSDLMLPSSSSTHNLIL